MVAIFVCFTLGSRFADGWSAGRLSCRKNGSRTAARLQGYCGRTYDYRFQKGDDQMMTDWNGYRQQLVETIGKIGRLSPETVKGYGILSTAGSKTNRLDAKMRELIALAVAVSLRCDGCITVHTDAAIKHGASRDEIAEVLGVAVSVNAGAALVYSARVMDAYEANPAATAVEK